MRPKLKNGPHLDFALSLHLYFVLSLNVCLLFLISCSNEWSQTKRRANLEVAVKLPDTPNTSTRPTTHLFLSSDKATRDLSFSIRATNGKDWDHSQSVSYGQSLLIDPPLGKVTLTMQLILAGLAQTSAERAPDQPGPDTGGTASTAPEDLCQSTEPIFLISNAETQLSIEPGKNRATLNLSEFREVAAIPLVVSLSDANNRPVAGQELTLRDGTTHQPLADPCQSSPHQNVRTDSSGRVYATVPDTGPTTRIALTMNHSLSAAQRQDVAQTFLWVTAPKVDGIGYVADLKLSETGKDERFQNSVQNIDAVDLDRNGISDAQDLAEGRLPLLDSSAKSEMLSRAVINVSSENSLIICEAPQIKRHEVLLLDAKLQAVLLTENADGSLVQDETNVTEFERKQKNKLWGTIPLENLKAGKKWACRLQLGKGTDLISTASNFEVSGDNGAFIPSVVNGACAHPFSAGGSAEIAQGSTIDSYGAASAATVEECNALKVTSTCGPNGLTPSAGSSATCQHLIQPRLSSATLTATYNYSTSKPTLTCSTPQPELSDASGSSAAASQEQLTSALNATYSLNFKITESGNELATQSINLRMGASSDPISFSFTAQALEHRVQTYLCTVTLNRDSQPSSAQVENSSNILRYVKPFIYSTPLGAFAALRRDGSVVTWGRNVSGGASINEPTSLQTGCPTAGDCVTTLGDTDNNGIADLLDAAKTGKMITKIVSTDQAFAAVREDGAAITWGNSRLGGESSKSPGSISNVVSHGDANSNGIATPLDPAEGAPRVTSIVSGKEAFAALREDGSVVSWGKSTMGGDSAIDGFSAENTVSFTDANQNRVGDRLDPLNDPKNVYTALVATGFAFAAIRSDGAVATWGSKGNGGGAAITSGTDLSVHSFGDNDPTDPDGTSDGFANLLDPNFSLFKPIVKIFSNLNSFAALRADGSVITWGQNDAGGDSVSAPGTVSDTETFGDGNSNGVAKELDPQENGDRKVVQLFQTGTAWAALRDDGSVVTWGREDQGGTSANASGTTSYTDVEIFRDSNNNKVADPMDPAFDAARKVKSISSNSSTFAALLENGAVLNWGAGVYGPVVRKSTSTYDFGQSVLFGDSNFNHYANRLDPSTTPFQKIKQIWSTEYAYAAQYENGDLVTWGRILRGGQMDGRTSDSLGAFFSSSANPVQKTLNGGIAVERVFSTSGAFCALREDGAVLSWGGVFYGGESRRTLDSGEYSTFGLIDADSNDIPDILDPNLNGGIRVVDVSTTNSAFAVLRSDGSVLAWGQSLWGGDPTGAQNFTGTEKRTFLGTLTSNPAVASLLSGI